MDSPVIVREPARLRLDRQRTRPDVGFFDDQNPLDLGDDQFDDPWAHISSRHPEFGNFRPWSTLNARKRRGSGAGHERVPGDVSDDRGRYFHDSFLEDLPEEFRNRISSRLNQHFEPEAAGTYSQTPPRQEYRQRPDVRQESRSSTKSTQTPVEEFDLKPNLTQHGLRNTVDFGQKTATDSDQLDAKTARNARSMSAPPGRRFASPQRATQPAEPGNASSSSQSSDGSNSGKQPAVRVIPIFVEGRDEPVINDLPEKPPQPEEPPQRPQYQEEYFTNHEVPHGFQQTSQRSFPRRSGGSPFGFARKFQQQEPSYQSPPFKMSPPPSGQPANVQIPVHHAQNEPQRSESPQPHPSINLNDPIVKIQLIQKDVLELMTRLENFSGTSKTDKEYMYLDEMLTRNLIKLDVIDTEGKDSIRSARKEAIKCIEKCIAVLEAKVDNANKECEGAVGVDSVTNLSDSDKCEERGASDVNEQNCAGNVMDVDPTSQ